MAEEVVVHLDQKIQLGHRLVNQNREIPNAEWLTLLALQEEIGVTRLLCWQARAATAGRTHISPAYYEQCAASEAFGSARQAQPSTEVPSVRAEERQEPITVPTPLAPPTPARPALDADQQAALRELEQAASERVRAPWRLAGTPAGCIRAWAQCIAHPGLVAYCRKPPLHYAVDQMALCLPPPSAAQLARWAASVTPGATGTRWSDAAIAAVQSRWGGLFALGSEVGEEPSPRPGGILPAPTRSLDDGYAERVRAQLASGTGPAAAEEPSTPPEEQQNDGYMTTLVTSMEHLWGSICSDLQHRLDRLAYRTWVRGASLVALTDDTAVVQARSDYQRDRLERCEGALIAEYLSVRLGRPIRVVITLGGDVLEELSASSPPGPRQEAHPTLPVVPVARPAAPPGPPTSAAGAAAPADDPTRPAWVSPALWATVPPVLRSALVGSTLHDGQIVPARLFYRRALDDARYADLLARLLAAVGLVRSV